MKKLFLLPFLIFTLSCSKDDDNSSTPQETPVDVYVSGSYGGSPAVWKNGELPSIISTISTTVNDMFIDGNDKYLIGSSLFTGKRAATVWKNGIPMNYFTAAERGFLTDGIIKNGIIHSVGYFEEIPATNYTRIMYFNNSNGTFISNSTKKAESSGLFIKDNNIYISGYESVSSTNYTYVAKYWKNGEEFVLSNGSIDEYATDIFVDTNNDVYISGYSRNASNGQTKPKYWKNGVEIPLETPQSGGAEAILKVGNDIYIVGYISTSLGSSGNRAACYWKNGVRTNLLNNAFTSTSKAITQNQGNIYIMGSLDGNDACYWKNGEIVNLAIPGLLNTYVSSIFVK